MNWLDALNPDDSDVVALAALPPERRSMAELRNIVTASEMTGRKSSPTCWPSRGQRIVARTATAHLNRPEHGSVLSTVVRHTAWLDDPRLVAAFSRSDFDLRYLERPTMTSISLCPQIVFAPAWALSAASLATP